MKLILAGLLLTSLLVTFTNCQYTVRQVLHAEGGPKPLGPYSEGLRVGDTIFVSGNIGT